MSDDETTQPDREAPLIEALAGAWRPRDPRELRSHPAFWDLSEDGRRRAHALALASRPLEAALLGLACRASEPPRVDADPAWVAFTPEHWLPGPRQLNPATNHLPYTTKGFSPVGKINSTPSSRLMAKARMGWRKRPFPTDPRSANPSVPTATSPPAQSECTAARRAGSRLRPTPA